MSDGAETASQSNTRSFNLRVFGCQMNFYDGELIRASMLRRGYSEAESPDDAGVVLFHTCSVRQHAEDRVHSLLGELKRRKAADPGLVVGVIGCMADREGTELFETEPHVDIVCGSRHFPRLPSLIDRVVGGEERVLEVGDAGDKVDAPVRDLVGRPEGHSAQVAVMRGCDLNCTFCIVPSVRGRVESRPVQEIVDECRRLADEGVTEITLLGQTIDAYGADLGRRSSAPGSPGGTRPKLGRLLDELAEIEHLLRVRLITLHPAYCDEDLADAMARSPQFLRLLPIPLQAGSDTVLKRMKRGYSVDLYRRRIDLLRDRMPDIELVSDWIVGFPGETDEDFAQSEARMREFEFLQSYVFQYSPRPSTSAFDLVDNVPLEVKKRRNHRLLELQHQIARTRTPQMVGRRSRVLLEGPDDRNEGFWSGRIDNGHRALLPTIPALSPGQLFEVDLVDYNGRELIARPTGAAWGPRPSAAVPVPEPPPQEPAPAWTPPETESFTV